MLYGLMSIDELISSDWWSRSVCFWCTIGMQDVGVVSVCLFLSFRICVLDTATRYRVTWYWYGSILFGHKRYIKTWRWRFYSRARGNRTTQMIFATWSVSFPGRHRCFILSCVDGITELHKSAGRMEVNSKSVSPSIYLLSKQFN